MLLVHGSILFNVIENFTFLLRERRSLAISIKEKTTLVFPVHFCSEIHRNTNSLRDLKPKNIFVTSSLDLVIGDFGVAAVDNEVRMHSSMIAGSLVWMSPEESAGKDYDSRCDVWSLGCVLVEIMTCKHFSDADIATRLMTLGSSDIEPVLTLISKVGF